MVTCQICGHQAKWLGDHLVESHKITIGEYLLQHPQAEISTVVRQRAGLIQAPDPTALTVNFGDVTVPINWDVEEHACLPLPPHYRVPQFGALKADVAAATIALASRRSMYIWGPAGAGKDAIFHAWSYLTHSPCKLFQIQPGVDTMSWFYSKGLGSNGSYWEEGELLTALRDGYLSPISGRRIPYTVLITDFDRANSEQAEALRLVMDSISGRVMGPKGVVYPVFPGTQIVVTANTAGGGDPNGRYTSARVIDASILDRFERSYQFHWMDWRDEIEVVTHKFPLLWSKNPTLFADIGKAVAALRTAIDAEKLYGEFSHRAVCMWLGAIQDYLTLLGDRCPANVAELAFDCYLAKLPDATARETAKLIVKPFLPVAQKRTNLR